MGKKIVQSSSFYRIAIPKFILLQLLVVSMCQKSIAKARQHQMQAVLHAENSVCLYVHVPNKFFFRKATQGLFRLSSETDRHWCIITIRSGDTIKSAEALKVWHAPKEVCGQNISSSEEIKYIKIQFAFERSSRWMFCSCISWHQGLLTMENTRRNAGWRESSTNKNLPDKRVPGWQYHSNRHCFET